VRCDQGPAARGNGPEGPDPRPTERRREPALTAELESGGP